ncbi:helix-turn-helix domain-containing protein [Belliella kenyensis]|uniref:Helix-turn-helix domain-containing protein n=1 Tax=Belliella kenyensis TaxID=1472724 RepID=A0ABV8ELD1_9BACT
MKREGLDSGLNFFYCHKKNWSQGDLTQQIGASREIIRKYERNENLPSIEMVAEMARAFGVMVDFFYWGRRKRLLQQRNSGQDQ